VKKGSEANHYDLGIELEPNNNKKKLFVDHLSFIFWTQQQNHLLGDYD
jgi:hypothetical protein